MQNWTNPPEPVAEMGINPLILQLLAFALGTGQQNQRWAAPLLCSLGRLRWPWSQNGSRLLTYLQCLLERTSLVYLFEMGSRLSGIRHSGRVFHVLNSVALRPNVWNCCNIFNTFIFTKLNAPCIFFGSTHLASRLLMCRAWNVTLLKVVLGVRVQCVNLV